MAKKEVKKSKEVLDADSSSHESDMQDDDGRSESAISSDELQLDEGDRFEYFQDDNPYVGLERANDGSLYYDEDNHEIQNAARRICKHRSSSCTFYKTCLWNCLLASSFDCACGT